MRIVFADTVYYLALLNARDEYHERATKYTAAFDGAFLTTAWVLTEVANYLAESKSRPAFASFLADLQKDRRVEIVPPTKALFEQGVRLYSSRNDKGWSLTDCISFHVMRDRGVIEALTADHHFEQAGFVVLLK